MTQKAYTAELTVNYNDGETTILEKHFDEFTGALEICRKFRKNAGVNYGGAVIRENDCADELYQCTAAGVEYFIAYRSHKDFGEIILSARGNSKRLTII